MKQLKALQLLKKIEQAEIDQIAPIVQQLAKEYRDISAEIDDLLLQAESERKQLNETGADHAAFGRYYSGVLLKVEALRQQLLEVEEKLSLVREELKQHFARAKRYEVAANNILTKQQAEEEKKLMDMFDDLAQRRH